jgi:predicted dehydrogenase
MTLNVAVVGAGLIGHRHAAAVDAAAGVLLSAIVDPGDVGATVASRHKVAHLSSLAALFEARPPDGVILATPNQLHLDHTLQCIDAGVPALIEKPLASSLAEAEEIVAAGKAAGIPLLTGHHRRHNPLVAAAKSIVEDGQLGTITAAHGSAWLCKPDDYFDVEWRRKKGAGPVYINLIHDIDMLRHLCGEIVSVHAMESNASRGNEVEDSAAILLRFESGALGTVNISDSIAAPWSWELTAQENPMYPVTDQSCYLIGGTHGSLSLPDLTVWSHPGKPSWWEPIDRRQIAFESADPLIRQVEQFAAVIRGEAPPLVSAEDGLKNQQIIEAVKTSAATGSTVHLKQPR